MKKVLFVCYGSGHVRMVVPVAQALQKNGMAQVQVLGLTTAAPVVRAAGLPLLQVKDFLRSTDAPALTVGCELITALGQVADVDETVAYLGLCYAELVSEVGEDEARKRYLHDGRHAFLPKRILSRILSTVRPDLVVVTNSPRAERAAVLAARQLGIPAVCMVDLFAVDEVRWIGERGYADRVCVLNERVRTFLLDAGREAYQVTVTGNPAFDALCDCESAAQGAALRAQQGWNGKRVLLWPSQIEPSFHPFDGRTGDPELPRKVLEELVGWVRSQPDAVLCVRPRAGDIPPPLPRDGRVVVTGQDWPLPALLHAVDVVTTLTSTVGLEGFLAGARVVQVRGSVFDEALPLARFGMADTAVALDALVPALERWTVAPRRQRAETVAATPRVVDVLREFL